MKVEKSESGGLKTFTTDIMGFLNGVREDMKRFNNAKGRLELLFNFVFHNLYYFYQEKRKRGGGITIMNTNTKRKREKKENDNNKENKNIF